MNYSMLRLSVTRKRKLEVNNLACLNIEKIYDSQKVAIFRKTFFLGFFFRSIPWDV